MKIKKIASIALITMIALTSVSTYVYANDATPSIEAKPAPTIDKVTTSESLGSLTVEEIVVTALASKDEANETISVALASAYEDLTSATSLEDLDSGLTDILSDANSEYTVADLAVRDLFDITIPDEFLETLNSDSDAYLTLTFSVDVEIDSELYVMAKCGDTWVTVKNENISFNDDGTVNVTFHEFCPIAFVTPDTTLSDTNVDTNVDTGDTTNTNVYLYLAIGSAVVAIAAVAFMKRKQKVN